MKRQTILGTIAALALSILATPAFAIPTPPSPPASCSQVNAGAGAWPLGPHTFVCGSASGANATLMMGPLNGFTGMPRANTEMKGLTGTTNRGNFYLFGTQAEYTAAFPAGTWAQPLPGDLGITVNDGVTGTPIFTAIFQKNALPTPIVNQFIANTTAHELGHWLNALEGAALSRQEKIQLTGTVTVGHTITVKIDNGNIPGSPVSVSATSVAGNTLTNMATKLAAAVNANTALTSVGISAVSAGDTFTVTYPGAGSGPTYSYVITGTGTITEQVWLDTGAKASAQPLFKHSLHGGNPETVTIGGTATVGDKVTLNFRDPAFSTSPSQVVTYTVSAGDTPTLIASALTAEINARTDLMGHLSATSVGGVITVTSVSGVTEYGGFVVGAGTETIFLPGDVPAFNKLVSCNAAVTAVFNLRQDSVTDYLCSTRVTGTLGGTVSGGNISVTFTDFYAQPTAPNKVTVTVSTSAGQSLATVAGNVATAINNDPKLISAHITATHAAGSLDVVITSASAYPTVFAYNAGATTTLMNLSVPGYGRNGSISDRKYSLNASNWTDLGIVAYPTAKLFTDDDETFAENYAIIANYDDRQIPPGSGVTNYQSQDWFFMFGTGGFQCIRNIISTAGNTRLPPTSFPAGCPVN